MNIECSSSSYSFLHFLMICKEKETPIEHKKSYILIMTRHLHLLLDIHSKKHKFLTKLNSEKTCRLFSIEVISVDFRFLPLRSFDSLNTQIQRK